MVSIILFHFCYGLSNSISSPCLEGSNNDQWRRLSVSLGLKRCFSCAIATPELLWRESANCLEAANDLDLGTKRSDPFCCQCVKSLPPSSTGEDLMLTPSWSCADQRESSHYAYLKTVTRNSTLLIAFCTTQVHTLTVHKKTSANQLFGVFPWSSAEKLSRDVSLFYNKNGRTCQHCRTEWTKALFLNPSPKVKDCKLSGKLTPSKLWLKASPKINVFKPQAFWGSELCAMSLRPEARWELQMLQASIVVPPKA